MYIVHENLAKRYVLRAEYLYLHTCTYMYIIYMYMYMYVPLPSSPVQIRTLQDENKRIKKAQNRNSVLFSKSYDMGSFSREQLALLEDRDQTISDLQFSLDERTAELEEVRGRRGRGRGRGGEGGVGQR